MYHKDLDQEKIIEAAIDLMVLEGPHAVSFRSVARSLGCAHTNIYNFFNDSESLFRACGQTILKHLEVQLKDSLHSRSKKQRLRSLYTTQIQFYLDHPGWFQLIWTYPIQLKDSVESKAALLDVIQNSVLLFADNFEYCRSLPQAHHLLHIVHAYLLGEVSIFFAGKSLFKNRKELESYVVDHCIYLTTVLDAEATNQLPHFGCNGFNP